VAARLAETSRKIAGGQATFGVLLSCKLLRKQMFWKKVKTNLKIAVVSVQKSTNLSHNTLRRPLWNLRLEKTSKISLTGQK